MENIMAIGILLGGIAFVLAAVFCGWSCIVNSARIEQVRADQNWQRARLARVEQIVCPEMNARVEKQTETK